MPKPTDKTHDLNSLSIIQGGGEMGALMRKYNWDAHPLGTPEKWPLSLQTNIRLLLNSNFPMFIWWSEEFYMFHNDAYLPALGKKHPAALGASAREMWAEIWHQLGVVAEGIMQDAKPFYAENLLVLMDRKGFTEETYWTFSYSAAFNDAGEVGGIFCACFEMTHTVLGQRRMKTLRDISDAAAQILTLEQTCQLICNILNENQTDVPFSLIYLVDNTASQAQLMGHAGDIRKAALPQTVDLTVQERAAANPFAQVMLTREKVVTDRVALSDTLHQEPATSKVVVYPIFGSGQVIGFFVTGISTQLEYDSDYENFHELLIGKISNAVTILRARQEMLFQQEYLRNIFQQAPVGIGIVSKPNYVIELANPQVCEIWGRPAEEVLGKALLEALPEVKDQGIIPLLDQVTFTGQPFIANELPLMLARNGQLEKVFLNFIYHPMRDGRGQITGVICVAIDITEHVLSRLEIEAVNQQLLTINADLDNFVYSASHDLKAPISNIEGLMQALVEYLPAVTLSDEHVQALIGHIDKSIHRFKRAVNDLTEVAKVQREAGEDVMPVSLPEIVAEVIQDFEPEIKRTGARLDLHFQDEAVIQFSAKNIRSVIYNLLSNALKYRAPERQPHIRFSGETTDRYTILSVTDNGLGINMQEKDKIFSMFKRLHDHVEGTGIGLYIIKRIVENAGGSIEVDSTVGQGSTFRIYFKHEHAGRFVGN